MHVDKINSPIKGDPLKQEMRSRLKLQHMMGYLNEKLYLKVVCLLLQVACFTVLRLILTEKSNVPKTVSKKQFISFAPL